ncbi:hypothetical protein AHGSH82_031450 [Aeromonas hydrophila]|uniref:hypothetical protein n=1 Tax=Aeromonas hydrophila TaxID=644 RepID=UPI00101B0F86|nr:hypothetical protein [Aeromonas hydrophila]BBG86000.1 hypothetical protein AHGSH82_031450 [Aeromonas hydrophila]BBT63296.1 hypothetical protein WP8S18E02_30930 [Aeromonas hydrophila]
MNQSVVPPPGRRYQLADLTMAGGRPWFAVHVLDEDGHTSSWIISGELNGDRFHFQPETWVPDAIQAIVGDNDGQIWAITSEDELVTNTNLAHLDGWQKVASHPQLEARASWFSRRVCYLTPDGEKAELAGCLCWVSGSLLIGTFERRLYSWKSGDVALLEHDDHVVGTMGGINNIVVTAQAVFALGYAGLILRRIAEGVWQRLPGPWPEEASAFVNLIAGVEGPQGELWVVAAGGSVVSVTSKEIRMVAQVPAEPLGITQFQRQWYVSTLDGCYELLGDGGVQLVKRNILMGKAIGAGACLIAFDAEPQCSDSAEIHFWLRTRSRDSWGHQIVCRP